MKRLPWLLSGYVILVLGKARLEREDLKSIIEKT